LRRYFDARVESDKVDSLVAAHMGDRPSLIYTLGWWMATRISDGGNDPDGLMAVLESPRTIFARYNASVPDHADSLRLHID
jgi:hypothetical protein